LLAAAGLPPDWYELRAFPPERKAIDVGSIYLDSRKAEQVLGWRPTVDLEEGLARTLSYYRQHKDAYWDADTVASFHKAGLQVKEHLLT
jgi:nucleoside-diphosphate-sugar epimerase